MQGGISVSSFSAQHPQGGGGGGGQGLQGLQGGGAGGWADKIAGINELQAQNNGVHRLHHSLGEIAPAQALAVGLLRAVTGGENLRVALTAEEQNPFVEDRQPLISAGGSPHKGLRSDPIVVPDIHAEKSPVIAGGLHIDVSLQQLRPARPGHSGPGQ